MKKTSLNLLFLIVFLSLESFSTTYYVDPLTGNDANTGVSQALAWRTIPGTRTASNSGLISSRWGSIDGVNKLLAGDIVEIKAGSLFSAANSGRIEITSAFYSGGANPVTVKCSTTWGVGDCIWDATGITLPDSSYPLIYIQTSNFTLTGGDSLHRVVVQKSVGSAILVSAVGGAGHTQKVQLNFIRATQNSGFGAIDFSNTDYGGMDNFEIDNNSYNGLTVGGGADQNTINLVFQNGKLHHNGLKSENVSIRQGNGAVAVGATNLTFRKVLAFNNKQDGFDNGSSGNNSACSATFDSVVAYNNGEDGIGANGGPNGGNTSKWKYYVVNSILQNNSATGLDAYAGANVEIYHSIFAGNGTQQYFGGNLIYYSSNDDGLPNITTVKLRNNIFYKPGQGSVSNVQIYNYNNNGIVANLDSDYNIFFPKNTSGDRISEVPWATEQNYTTRAAWLGPNDKIGSAMDPGFVAYNALDYLVSDFHLKASSGPAINSGIYLIAPAIALFDGAGATRTNPPDIGAFEYAGVTPPPVLTVNAPSNLVTGTIAANSIAISWTDSSTNETNMIVERRLQSASTFAQLISLGSNTINYLDTSVLASTAYCYRVKAIASSVSSSYSNEICATTLAVVVPPPPPPPPPATAEIVIDNNLAGTSFTGKWCNSSGLGYYGTISVYSCGSVLDSYRFTPTISQSGMYDVYFRYTSHANRSSSVPVVVVSANPMATKLVDQKTGGGVWRLHGRYQLNQGTGNYVEISAQNGQANADAVRFVPVSSTTTSAISLFTTQVPVILNANDGVSYELGMKVQTSKAGQIKAIKYYKASLDTGVHVGSIWSSTGALLGRVTFSAETSSGWQTQNLAVPIAVAAGAVITVSVNANRYFVDTLSGFNSAIVNGALTGLADGKNGVYGNMGVFPQSSYQNSNYFRDIVFVPNP